MDSLKGFGRAIVAIKIGPVVVVCVKKLAWVFGAMRSVLVVAWVEEIPGGSAR